MATGNNPIIDNAARHPKTVAQAILNRPTLLCDETSAVVEVVAKMLVRKGLRAEMLEVCESAGLDGARRAIVRAACNPGRVVH